MIRLEEILARVGKYHPGDNLDLIRRAYIFSAKEHKGQVRASGEAYLTHPLEVANILAEMKMDAVTVSVGLLHDVVEDTLTSLEKIEELFGSRSCPHRRRRNQDQPDPFHITRRKAGGEFPQNAFSYDRRYSRDHGEICRSPPQYADARISSRGPARSHRPRDHGDLCPPGEPPGYGQNPWRTGRSCVQLSRSKGLSGIEGRRRSQAQVT